MAALLFSQKTEPPFPFALRDKTDGGTGHVSSFVTMTASRPSMAPAS